MKKINQSVLRNVEPWVKSLLWLGLHDATSIIADLFLILARIKPGNLPSFFFNGVTYALIKDLKLNKSNLFKLVKIGLNCNI